MAITNWITNDTPVEPFSYPDIEIQTCEDMYWKLAFKPTEKKRIKVRITEKTAFKNFVCLAAAVWAQISQERYKLLGGPEMTDDPILNEKRLAAKLLKRDN